MIFIIAFVVVLLVLDVAAIRWGADSRDRRKSPEYVRAYVRSNDH
jgi:hypothetical protein